jgi:hypothetical protein
MLRKIRPVVDAAFAKLSLFVVRNRDGKFFRRKGYGGRGDSWVSDLATARIYAKVGGARAIVSFFASKYPEFGVPDIVKLTVGATEVLNEAERIAAVIEKKKAARETKELHKKADELRAAQANFDRAKATLDAKKASAQTTKRR